MIIPDTIFICLPLCFYPYVNELLYKWKLQLSFRVHSFVSSWFLASYWLHFTHHCKTKQNTAECWSFTLMFRWGSPTPIKSNAVIHKRLESGQFVVVVTFISLWPGKTTQKRFILIHSIRELDTLQRRNTREAKLKVAKSQWWSLAT